MFTPGDDDLIDFHLSRLAMLLIGSFPSQLTYQNQGASICRAHLRNLLHFALAFFSLCLSEILELITEFWEKALVVGD